MEREIHHLQWNVFSTGRGEFPACYVSLPGYKKAITKRLHLGPPLLSTRESILISSQGCFKFTSDIYNPFLSNQSEQNHTKYIYSFIVKCIAQQKTNTSLATKGVVFFPLFPCPQKDTPTKSGRSFVAFYTWRRSRSSIGWPSKWCMRNFPKAGWWWWRGPPQETRWWFL